MTADPPDNNRRILVVDDNTQIHADFRKILACSAKSSSRLAEFEQEIFGDKASDPVEVAAGFDVETAEQGQQGARMVASAKQAGRPFAMVFVDMRMPPGWDGLETIEQMWKDDPNLEVVICTAYSDHSWAEISTRLTRSDQLLILKKPFDSVEARQLAACLTQKWELGRQSRLRMAELKDTVELRTSERNEGLRQRDLARESLDILSHQNRRILEWVGQPVLAIDRDGTISLVNEAAAEVLGWPIEQLTGRSFHATVHAEHAGPGCVWESFPYLEIFNDGRELDVLEDVFVRQDGSSFEIELVCTQNRDSAGVMRGVVIMFCTKLI